MRVAANQTGRRTTKKPNGTANIMVKPISVMYVMATEAEYGPCLRNRIAPLITGVGPVEAAISVTRALCSAVAKDSMPSHVVSLGSAGSIRLEHTQVYQAYSVSYRDMKADILGFERGVTPFLDLPAELLLEPQVPGIPSARLSTGGDIVSEEAYDELIGDMADMETYAVHRVCQSFGVSHIALRGISDGKNKLRDLDDWVRDLDVVDMNLCSAIEITERYIASGIRK